MQPEHHPPIEVESEALGLYSPDGKVIFAAVAAYIEAQQAIQNPPEASPLAEHTNRIHTVSVDQLIEETEKDDSDTLDWLGKPGSLSFAINSYLSYEIGRSIHGDRVPASEGFTGNPNFAPDLQTETMRVLEIICDQQPGVYSFLEKTMEDITPWTALAENLRAIGAVPVAGLQEAKNIYNTLEQYAIQDMPHDQFEVFVNVNLPAQEDEQDGTSVDILMTTLDEITRFTDTYPDITIRRFGTRYIGDRPSIASIRADSFNVIGLDLLRRGRAADIHVISNDADTVQLSPHYLSNIAETAESSKADIITGRLRWQQIEALPADAPANTLLAFGALLSNAFNDYALETEGFNLLTSDANTAISLATYFAVGGFQRGLALGEMHKLVTKIRQTRQGSTAEIETCAKEAHLTTHSRRLIEVMALGHPPTKAWDQNILTFGHDDELRTAAQRVIEANSNAALHFELWLREIAKAYLGPLPEVRSQEIISRARNDLQI